MTRHLVHSLILTAVLSPLVSAGPCRPSSSSTITATSVTSQSVVTDSATASIAESTETELSSSLLSTTVTESKTTDSASSLETTTTGISSSVTEITTTTSEDATTTTTEAAATTTAGETPTCEDTDPIKNAGWDTGKFSPWKYYPVADGREIVDFSIEAGGADGTGFRLQTGNFHFDKSMWLYQDLKACPGIRFRCSFMWQWDKYYAIKQNDGSSLVPYVRIYQDEDTRALVSEYPSGEAQTQRWIESDSFDFTIPESGETRIWYVASSPQGEWINTSTDPNKPNWVQRTNKLALDSLVCQPW